MKRFALIAIYLASSTAAVLAEPFTAPPPGYALVAEDDCGDSEASPHVVRGRTYVFDSGMVTGTPSERDIVFDDERCVLRYDRLNPAASYKIDVVYVGQAGAGRVQSLEAGGLVVHDALPVPETLPGRFLFDVPAAACAGGSLELAVIKRGGANAVVSAVRLWSTDPTPLPGKRSLWVPSGPIEFDWLRQDRLRGRPVFTRDPGAEPALDPSVLPCLDEQLQRGEAVLRDLQDLDVTGLGPLSEELAAVATDRDALLAAGSQDPEPWLRLYLRARWAVRRAIFLHPRLDEPGLLFVRRHHADYMHQCARRLGAFTLPGGAICTLTGLRPDADPTVTPLTEGLFPEGTYTRPDLSFDGRRLVFGYAPRRLGPGTDPGSRGVTEARAPLFADQKVGPCEPFQVWEMNLTGDASPRKLTEGPAENSDPLYLPDGRIAFMSHRAGGLVQCGDWALSYCVFAMNRDGSDVRQVTVSKDGEWDPFLMDDGTIGFTRWEYVMKFWSPIQMLWSVRPDGSNPRMTYGSDLARSYAYPLNYASARQIPGTSKVVCIGSAHHNTGAGPLCIVDLAIGPSEASGLQRLTPVRFVETSDYQPDAGWYDCPYPLGEHYFLASYSFAADETRTDAYGLYLVDGYGGKELLYRDPELSALFPMPLGARKQPPALPPVLAEDPSGMGEFLIQDVHAGLPPQMQGAARYIQVVECHERKQHTAPYAIEVGPDSGFETKTVLGTVPVESDGSAYFRVPAGKSVFLSVLDADYRALHTMRSVTNLQPGERTGCVGCHEGMRRVPMTRSLQASRRAPSALETPPWGDQPMDYTRVIQPVLDRNCTSCHDGRAGRPDLTANQTRPWMGVPLPLSYYNLRTVVRHAPMFTYSMPAGTFGSRVSPLTEMLAAGHHDLTLPPADWRALCAWIDCNAPGIGDYSMAALENAAERQQTAVQSERARLAEGRGSLEQRRADLAAALPAGEALIAYVDCGPQGQDTAEGVTLRELAGMPFDFGGREAAAPWFGDISFDNLAVVYEALGLDPTARYRLNFSWWDFDNGGREQSVILTTPEGREATLLGPTRLPGWSGLRQAPATLGVDLPPALTSEGRARLAFTNTSGKANAVLSEVWLTRLN